MAERPEFQVPEDIFLVFQIFGVFPLALNSGQGTNLILKCVSITNSVIIVIITCLSLYFALDIFDKTNTIGLFVDILQIMAPILTHLVICIEVLARSKTYKIFWVQFERTFQLVQQLDGELAADLKRFHKRSRNVFFILFVVPLFIEVRILYGIFGNFWFYSRIAAEFSYIGCRLSFLQFSFHVGVINWFLQRLELEVRRISNESRSQLKCVEWEMESMVSYKRMHMVKRAMRDIFNLTSTLNSCYQWSLLANLTNNFLSITVAFYWNYRSLYFNNLIFQAESLMVSLPLQIILFYVMFTCEKCFKPLAKIIYYLNRMVRHPQNYPLHHLLRHFLLQLLNQRFVLSAMGFMEMDFMSLKDMIAAITTYLVIFIQFMPKDGTAVDNSTIIQD